MKRLFIALAAILISANCISAETLHIRTGNTSLVQSVKKGGKADYLYYGDRISDADATSLPGSGVRYINACPVFGMNGEYEPLISATQPDGNMTLDVKVESWECPDGENAVILLKDRVYPFYIELHFRARPECDIIETWTEIHHEARKEVTLNRFGSAVLPIRRGNVWVSHLYGSWANEARLVEEKLEPGQLGIQNRAVVRNAVRSHAEVMISLDGKARENSGRVIGAALCYGGNYKLLFETDNSDFHRMIAGINEQNSEYHLRKGERFVTPFLALTYSKEGLGGASRSFHRWGRDYMLFHGDRERKVLLNSWEGVYFNINEEGMHNMMSDIASMGGELFVMDDGWFGEKYPSVNDKAGLGDWMVDRRKLPDGVKGLVSAAADRGIRFGIWIEPEMLNTTSELYEKHPDWVLNAPGREPVKGRGGTQMVLDLCNPEVQDFAFKVIDDIMQENPEIDYIKWDANMSLLSYGSPYLPADRQSHIYIEYHRGLENVCRRMREKYPDLTVQLCSSGGARANYGLLRYFDEFWVSDNTDALQRVYMQWGTSYFFPAIAMASHISASPNHQTGRKIPLKYRIDVAMSGRLGMEIQPKNMTEEEKNQCRKGIADYKRVRPVIQFGDQYRLLSPYEGAGAASLMYVSQDRDEAVFFWWKTEHFYNQHLPKIAMAGLDPDATYRIEELDSDGGKAPGFVGKSFTGRFLMSSGLEIPAGGEYASRVLHLGRVPGIKAVWTSTGIPCDKSAIEGEPSGTTLAGWAGERVNAVLKFSPEKNVCGLEFTVNEIACGNNVIPGANASLRQVRYTLGDSPEPKCLCNRKPDQPSRMVPDLLDHISIRDLEAGETESIWLTIDIPADTRPGTYESTVTIKGDGGTRIELPFTVKVQNHILPAPAQWSYHLDLWQHPAAAARFHNAGMWSDRHFKALETEMSALVNAGQKVITCTLNRDPWNHQCFDAYEDMIVWTLRRDGSWHYDYSVFDRWVNLMMSMGVNKMINCYSLVPWNCLLDYFDEATGSKVTVSAKPGKPEFERMWKPFLTDFASHLKEKGWLGITNIAMDERSPEEMDAAAALLSECAPDLGFAIADNHKSYRKFTMRMDVCVSMKFGMSAEDIAKRRAEGFNSTFYVSCSTQSPNTFTFSPAYESEFLIWYGEYRGYDGMLRWAWNSWPEDPVNDSRFGKFPSGDTYFGYPGGRVSIRYEMMRDGIEAAEKMRILSAEGHSEEVKAILDVFGEKEPDAPSFNMADALARAKEMLYSLSDSQ